MIGDPHPPVLALTGYEAEAARVLGLMRRLELLVKAHALGLPPPWLPGFCEHRMQEWACPECAPSHSS